MSRGGARNRSGPPPDPKSGRSDRRELVLTALPSEGYLDEIPDFPLPDMSVREGEVWEQAWRTPQACAWAVEPWRWRAVAMWVRWSVRMEAEEASAALGNVVVRFADQIGMTPAGLKENGWAIAKDQLAEKRAESAEPTAAPPSDIKNRFTVVADGSGG